MGPTLVCAPQSASLATRLSYSWNDASWNSSLLQATRFVSVEAGDVGNDV